MFQTLFQIPDIQNVAKPRGKRALPASCRGWLAEVDLADPAWYEFQQECAFGNRLFRQGNARRDVAFRNQTGEYPTYQGFNALRPKTGRWCGGEPLGNPLKGGWGGWG